MALSLLKLLKTIEFKRKLITFAVGCSAFNILSELDKMGKKEVEFLFTICINNLKILLHPISELAPLSKVL